MLALTTTARQPRLPFLLAILTSALITGCGTADRDDESGSGAGTGGDSNFNSSTASCDLPTMRNWVNDGMNDYYLFSDQVPVVNLNDYADVETLITDLRVEPFDRFSYIDDAARSNAFFEEGEYFGFGMRLVRTSNTDVQFKLINPGSPIAQFDVQRGDYLRAINGVDLNVITNAQIDSFLGTGDTVVSPQLTIQRGTNAPFDITVTKSTFNLQTVLATDVVQQGNQRVGYLHFLSFIEPSAAELDAAFTYFDTQDVNELVLDLRYNSGGRIDIAGKLAAQIAGNFVQSQDFARFQYNSRYSSNNFEFEFPQQTTALDLNRVFILTTDETCSASEMVINGLRPFVDVITVGSTSCGKPYGTYGDENCGKVMHALSVSFVNANGAGDYYDGLNADCPANDNMNDTLGNPTEALFSQALEYINTGSCSAIAYKAKSPTSAYERLKPDSFEKAGLLR